MIKLPIVVKARKDERNEDVIRRFKKKVVQDQVLTEIKKREFYKKPSQIKKEKRKEIEQRKKLQEKYGNK